jgi:hypothetical protein
MRLIEYSDKSIFSLIEKNCSKYLELMAAANRWILRGVQPDEAKERLYFSGKSRNKRKTLDSSQIAQTIFDTCLTKMGVTALRSNSIFCANSPYTVKNYGRAYLIFPHNSASFAWSQAQDDLVLHLNSFKGIIDYHLNPKYLKEWTNIRYKLLEFAKTIEKLDTTQHLGLSKYSMQIKAAKILSRYITNIIYTKDPDEQMLRIKSLYGSTYQFSSLLGHPVGKDLFNQTFELVTKSINKAIIDYNSLDLHKFQNKFKIDNTDLVGCLKSNHSLWIHGKYIALDYDEYYQKCKEHFNRN